jgi:hypothetical protein
VCDEAREAALVSKTDVQNETAISTSLAAKLETRAAESSFAQMSPDK